jgi:hypothetical protein
MKCVFCGTIKQCEPYLQRVFNNIERLGTLFDEYAIVVYCDKSNDNSYHLLNQYRKINPRLNFYYNTKPISRFRTHRLAHARNECMKVIRNHFSDFPYFIMMDFDDVCTEPVKLNVLQKYLHQDTWDALSFNKDPYYDIWALSIHPYSFSYHHLETNPCVVMRKYISDMLKSSNDLVKCMSAFNGFAIYRTSKFLNCHYDGTLRLDLMPKKYISVALRIIKNKLRFKSPGTEESTMEDCEHRSFHLMAINQNGARIRIAPEILF